MTIKKHIPNAITCGNLLCGCIGIQFCLLHRLDYAFYSVIIAAVLDFFDGFAARLLKVSSPIGKDLDSLADMVTFGVLPGFIMNMMLWGSSSLGRDSKLDLYLPFLAFMIPVFSALRLAKFNNDTRQSDSFIGVPTPANTILISSLGYILFGDFSDIAMFKSQYAPTPPDTFLDLQFLKNQYWLVSITLITSFLLIAELPLFALKFKNFGWTDNKLRYLFLIIAVILLILFQVTALPFIILLYILLSVINNFTNRKKTINS